VNNKYPIRVETNNSDKNETYLERIYAVRFTGLLNTSNNNPFVLSRMNILTETNNTMKKMVSYKSDIYCSYAV